MTDASPTIAMGSDHRGYEAVDSISEHLRAAGWSIEILGRSESDEPSVDYPDVAAEVTAAVRDGRASVGILMCGSGIGMSIAANKVHGIRAALVNDPIAAEMSRRHNDANVLCIGSDRLEGSEMETIVDTWLSTEFEGGRHARRVQKISGLEAVPDPSP